MGLTVGDFDRDGRQDIFVSAVHYSNKSCPVFSCFFGEIGNGLYLGNGDRKFKMADKVSSMIAGFNILILITSSHILSS